MPATQQHMKKLQGLKVKQQSLLQQQQQQLW
jgi:hypothetical protein